MSEEKKAVVVRATTTGMVGFEAPPPKLAAIDQGSFADALKDMQAWCRKKAQDADQEAKELLREHEIARRNKWRSATLETHAKLAEQRALFYANAAAAVEKGYVPIPDLPGVQVFAIRKIRTDKKTKAEIIKYVDPKYVWSPPEFPVRFCKPEIMEATNRAMAIGVFDQIGVLADFKDPLILGRVLDKSRVVPWRTHQRGTSYRALNFVIGWYFDLRGL